MGMPTSDEEKLVWHFLPVRAYAAQDPALQPYNWTNPPTLDLPGNSSVPTGTLIVDYALEFSAASSVAGQSDVGRFDTSRIVVTLLDEDYEQVREADFAMIGRVRYDITFTGPPLGMFDVTVFQVYMQARDEA